MYNEDIPKYRKRKKKERPKKTDHKHDYSIEVLVEKETKFGLRYHYGQQCIICGKIDNEKIIETKPVGGKSHQMLTQEEIKEKYKDLQIVRKEE